MDLRTSLAFGSKLNKDPSPSSLQAILHGAAENHGSEGVIYLRSDGDEVFQRYEALALAALRTLRGLQRAGIRAGQKVIIQIEEPEAFFPTFWACVLGGIIPAPLAKPSSFELESSGFERMRNVWHILDEPVVLIDSKDAADYRRANTKTRTLSYQELADETTEGDQVCVCPESIAFLQFSSGSTGQPKGVVLSHENLISNIAAIIQALKIEPTERSCSWLPHTHDMGLIGMHMSPLYAGTTQVRMKPELFVRRPSLYLSAISRHRASVTASTNFGLAWLVERIGTNQTRDLDLSCIRVLLNGAEPISSKVMRDFCEKFGACGFRQEAMCPVYGLAEASLAVTFSPIPSSALVTHLASRAALTERGLFQPCADLGEPTTELVDVGVPVAGVELRVVDGTDSVVPEGTVGHIQISGANVTKGYYGVDPDGSGLFCDRWLRTGDLGFLWKGHLTISGRSKEMIIIHGQNWFAHDIEELLYTKANIRRGLAVVTSNAASRNDAEQLLVFIMHRGDVGSFIPTVIRVQETIGKELGLEVGAIVPIAKVPHTTSGKVRRFWLTQEFERGKFADTLATLTDLLQRQSTADALTIEQPRTDLERQIQQIWADVLGLDARQIGVTRSFREFGGTSVRAMQVLGGLEQLCRRELSHQVLIKCQTIREIAAYLGGSNGPVTSVSSLVSPTRDVAPDSSRDIAIVGMACRFPKARDVASLWENLRSGLSLIRPVSETRKRLSGHTDWSDYLAEVDDIDRFDAPFFGMPDDEAPFVDPQQKLAMEVAYEALEDCGLAGTIGSRLSAAVFIGASQNSYQELLWRHLDRPGVRASLPSTLLVGNLVNMIAARISQFFDWNGPALTIDSACSSSLVAVKYAVDCLRRNESRYALAGGVNLLTSPTTHQLAMQAGILSHTNRCKVFDIEADGTVLGEGVGMVLLCRLSTAMEERRPIYGVIKGAAVNNDGRSLGVMAPNPDGQIAVLAEAYADARVDVSTLGYLEAHGTGTPVGDPVEIKALTSFLKQSSSITRQCGVGSVKANLGHLLAASGIAGLFKTVLSLKHQTLVPTANLDIANPLFDIQDAPYYLVKDTAIWPEASDMPRRGGVSSFGFGGTNCHIVLEEAPVPARGVEGEAGPEQRQYLLPFSAKRPDALAAIALNLIEYLERNSDSAIADVVHTLQLGRQALEHRAFIVACNVPDAVSQLQRVADGLANPPRVSVPPSGIAFLFPGQGAQHVDMGRELYDLEPTFRREVDECCSHLRVSLGLDLRELIYPSSIARNGASDRLAQTQYAQPALFVIEWATAQLLRSWGIQPTRVLGHSLGEYVAATVAGVFDRDDALDLVAERGRLMQKGIPGCMLSVALSEADLSDFLLSHEDLSLAAVNSPSNCVIAGPSESVNAAQVELLDRGITVRRLNVSHAFHTKDCFAASNEFGAMIRSKSKHTPKLAILSTVTGRALTDAEATSNEYWQRQIIQTVRFSDAVVALCDESNLSLLELGPGSALTTLVRHQPVLSKRTVVTHTLPHPELGQSDHWSILQAVGKLWQAKHPIDWSNLQACGKFLNLPTYPFEDRRYWISTQIEGSSFAGWSDLSASQCVARRGTHADSEPQYLAPRSETEIRIVDILEEVLQRRPIGIRQNFFELGGDSLAATRAIARLQASLHLDLPMNLIFKHQTPESLGAALDQLISASATNTPTEERATYSQGKQRVPLAES